jgi:hypothetical protein
LTGEALVKWQDKLRADKHTLKERNLRLVDRKHDDKVKEVRRVRKEVDRKKMREKKEAAKAEADARKKEEMEGEAPKPPVKKKRRG